MYYEYDYASCAFAWPETSRSLLFKMRKQEDHEFGTLPAMENRHMCEKMSMSPARDNLGFFLRKTCLYITYIGKELFLLWPRKGFILFLLNVDDNCYKRQRTQLRNNFMVSLK